MSILYRRLLKPKNCLKTIDFVLKLSFQFCYHFILMFVLVFVNRKTPINNKYHPWYYYPRDVVSAVLATATWLAGWLSVIAGMVSKRLNLS